MAKNACCTRKALNLEYKIRIQEFTKNPITDGKENKPGWMYTADLIVDKYPEYHIPPSTWTITLTVDANGKVSEELQPKDGPESLKNPKPVLVEWRVRMGRLNWNDKDNAGHDWRQHIGPAGVKPEFSQPLSELVERPGFSVGQGLRGLSSDPYVCVLVSLTFAVDSMADCTLICGDHAFSVNRALLSAQSPVFAALFQNEVKKLENASGMYMIKDLSPDVLDALLQFVNTGHVTNAEQLHELCIAADKLQMPDLKKECEGQLVNLYTKQRGMKRLKVDPATITSQQPI